MIGLKGESLTFEEKKRIEKYDIGAVILFRRNARTYEGLKNLCRQMSQLKTSSPLLIAIDREGHPVDRLQDIPEFMNWKVPINPKLSLNEIYQTSFFLNQELKHIGIHMNLSPCLDLSHSKNPVLKNRTFSKNPVRVGHVGQAWIQGSLNAGVLSCTKHFPGHGNVLEDSHLERPIDHSSKEKLDFSMLPFKQNIHSPSTMLSHILYPCLDSQYEASLSKKIIQNILKDKLGFSGLILSDDIDMKALQKYSSIEFVQISLEAGTHMFICGNSQENVETLILESQKRKEMQKWIQIRTQEVVQFKKKRQAYLMPTSTFPRLNPARKEWFKNLQNRFE